MQTIYKYTLEVVDEQIIQMPGGSGFVDLLSVQIQNGKPCLWAFVDKEMELAPVKIKIIGTGHSIDGVWDYIDTFQMMNGELVFHVFEGKMG